MSKKEISRRFPVTMHFRCTEADRDIICRRAAETGYTLSEFMRRRTTGGKTSRPVQDDADMAQLSQHFGLCKKLVVDRAEIRPVLKQIAALIAKMSEKVD